MGEIPWPGRAERRLLVPRPKPTYLGIESVNQAITAYHDAEQAYKAMGNENRLASENGLASLTQAKGMAYARGQQDAEASSCFRSNSRVTHQFVDILERLPCTVGVSEACQIVPPAPKAPSARAATCSSPATAAAATAWKPSGCPAAA
jgi:hypothetical protein